MNFALLILICYMYSPSIDRKHGVKKQPESDTEIGTVISNKIVEMESIKTSEEKKGGEITLF